MLNIYHRQYHDIGRTAFELRYGVDLEKEILRLNAEYDRLLPKVEKPRKTRQLVPQITEVKVKHCLCGQVHNVPAGKLTESQGQYQYWCRKSGYVLAGFRRRV